MKYDFDEIIERRNTNALNTDGFRGSVFRPDPEKPLPYQDEDMIRMWVADMEFACCPAICDAIKARVDKRIFGYTMMSDDTYFNALNGWCVQRYGWSFPKEELCFSPGIVPAIFQLIEDLVAEEESFVITTPSYGSFLRAAKYNNAPVLCSNLINRDGHFTIDFDDLEKKCADPSVKLLLWCNPHNPTGRIWTEAELKRVAEIVEKNDLWVISDEIHCDLTRSGLRHTPLGKIMPEYRKLITCMSASKTFNIAGLMFSDIIIRDETERDRFISRDKIGGMLNPLSLVAHLAAYEKGGEWLEQLRAYLDDNFSYVKGFLTENLPEAVFEIPEATYLAWVDLSECLPDVKDLPDFFAKEAGVVLEGGNRMFVGNAEGFVRLNLAMPRSIIQTGLTRMTEAIRKQSRAR